MQCAQSIDKFGYASLRSEEVTGGTKMKARITVNSRTNAVDSRTQRASSRLISGSVRKRNNLRQVVSKERCAVSD